MPHYNRSIHGLFDDIEKIVRPVDANGNPLPMATIDTTIDWQTAAMLVGAIAIGSGMGDVIGKHLSKIF